MQILHESQKDLLTDRQFQLRHITISKNYDYHKLLIPINIYRLGRSFIDVVSTGRNDMLQLGTEEGFIEVTSKLSNQTNSTLTKQNKNDNRAGKAALGNSDAE